MQTRKWEVKVAMLCLCLGIASTCPAKVIYVDADATGANNGSSWADAYNYLQDALSDANSSPKPLEIRIAEGTYRPDENTLNPNGTGNQDTTFQLSNSVTVRGGFAGFGHLDPNIRDVELYPSILSGDLDGDDAVLSDPRQLRDNEPTRDENSDTIVSGTGTDSTAVLDGFIITGAQAGNVKAAMHNNPGSPTVRNCTFAWNYSVIGGGMYNRRGASPTITNCTFSYNAAGTGAGIANRDVGTDPTVTNCVFVGNFAAGDGGGVDIFSGSNPTLINCVFTGNSAVYDGGGISNGSGNPTLTNCAFYGNTTGPEGRGGGIHSSGRTPLFVNCTFSRNSAGAGGGIHFWGADKPTLRNCTFSGNVATNGAALACDSQFHENSDNPRLVNCILWDVGNETWVNDNSTITIDYSVVQGGFPGRGNIDADPLFVDPLADNCHLAAHSPCINAGDPGYAAEPGETDIDGDPRVLSGRIDMGVDEFDQPAPVIRTSHSILEFFAYTAGPHFQSHALTVRNIGTGTINWQITELCPWLDVSPTSGESAGDIDDVLLTVDTSGLPEGTYNYEILVEASEAINTPQKVVATLYLFEPLIEVTPSSVEFIPDEGQRHPVNQTVYIRNTGSGDLVWTILEDSPWLHVDPTSGRSDGESNALSLTADIAGLSPGEYTCSLTVVDANASNSPQIVPVALYVSQPYIKHLPASFDFAVLEDGANTSDDILYIGNGGGGTLKWQIIEDCNWLDALPVSGESTDELDQVVLSINTAAWPPDDCNCPLSISAPDAANTPQTVQITAVLIKELRVPSPDFPTIQSAIDAAADRDIVVVEPNTYHEAINFGGKNVTVRSIDPTDFNIVNSTILEGEGNHRLVTFDGSETALCKFSGFTIIGGGTAGDGAGILGNRTHAAIENCTFALCWADGEGGAISSCSGRIYNCIVVNCFARRGAAMYNCDGEIVNCTVAFNESYWGYDEALVGCSAEIKNCIFYANGPADMSAASKPTYSCFSRATGLGNIDADPLFVAPYPFEMGADYHLKSEMGRWDPTTQAWVKDDVTSPCIDAGDPNSDWTGELWPHGKRINMGAYGGTSQASMSRSPIGNKADLNNDGLVNALDLFILGDSWLLEDLLLGRNINRTGPVNLADFAEFGKNWMWSE